MKPMTAFILTSILMFAAVARVTRIVTTDFISEPFRLWVMNRRGVDSKITYLLHCQWCLSLWVGAIAAGVVVWLHPAPGVNLWVQGVGLAALYSYATGVLAEWVDGLSDDEGDHA